MNNLDPPRRPRGFGWCSVCGQCWIHVDWQGRLLCSTCSLHQAVDEPKLG
jgi:hypothetical protein